MRFKSLLAARDDDVLVDRFSAFGLIMVLVD